MKKKEKKSEGKKHDFLGINSYWNTLAEEWEVNPKRPLGKRLMYLKKTK